MLITAEMMRHVLGPHTAVVEKALEHFSDPDRPLTLAGLRPLEALYGSMAEVLASILTTSPKSGRFVAYLQARGVDLEPIETEGDVWDSDDRTLNGSGIGPPPQADFPFERIQAFVPRAMAFRCLVRVGGKVSGSGAFVSPRLVLTAAHVIEDLTDAMEAAPAAGEEHPHLPALQVVASDGEPYSARYVWHSPVHENDRLGRLPSGPGAADHRDVALLRVMLPLGQSYGRIELPDPPISWSGPRLLALVHYPDGERRGFCTGRVLREADTDLRLRHNVRTAPGSSGGPGFDRNLEFIGLHQGREEAFRRLVPHALFAADGAFRGPVEKDRPPRYLWSLDGNPDGPLIIGRRSYFTGLADMLERPDTRLRGLWVRRVFSSELTGLSFSFRMLEAFLASQQSPAAPRQRHRCIQVPTALGDIDLTGALAAEGLGPGADPSPAAGVRVDETSMVASERDRALNLAVALNAHAAGTGQTFWLFFEPPPRNELGERARIQLEHLSELLIQQPCLRLVLAGFEQYNLPPFRFETVEEADHARRPGLLVDMLGGFTEADVRVTVTAMLRDLTGEDDISARDPDRLVAKVVAGLEETRAGVFAFDQLGEAGERLRNVVKTELDLD